MRPVLFFAVLLAVTVVAHAEEARALQPRVFPETVTVGDLLTYSVEVPLKGGETIAGPGPQADFGIWEVRGYSVRPGDGKATLTYTLTAFQTGKLEIPAITISIAGPQGKIRRVRTAPMKVTVASVLSGKDDKPADIVGPLALRESAWGIAVRVLLGVVVLAALGLIGWLLWSRRKRRIAERDRRPEPPDVVALKALAALRAAGMPEAGHIKQHYSQLSDILRSYIAARWGLRTLEETTRQIVRQMREHPACAEYAPVVEDLLGEADLVKFAKARPQPAACWSAVEGAERFVRATAMRAAVTDLDHAGDRSE